jgi:hypothetical protein
MASSRNERLSDATREVVQSVAERIFEWLQTRCTTDQNYAFGNTYETTWSKEITDLLNNQGLTSRHQRYYPGSRTSCDVVTALPDGQELWVEVKGAWLTTQHRTDAEGRITYLKNPAFRKHLFNAQESTLKDLTVKLPSIIRPGIVGAVLVIAFDSYACTMDPAIDELTVQAGLGVSWSLLYKEWCNPHDEKYRIRCWFWYQ